MLERKQLLGQESVARRKCSRAALLRVVIQIHGTLGLGNAWSCQLPLQTQISSQPPRFAALGTWRLVTGD